MYDFEAMDKRLLVFGNIFMTANRLQRAMNSQIKELSAKQWFVLMVLGMFDDAPTLKELANLCDYTHQNTKQIVLKLEEKGFVRLEKDAFDKRALRIFTTAKVEDWDKENSVYARQFVDTMFAKVTEEEIKVINRGLLEIYEQLGKLCGQNKVYSPQEEQLIKQAKGEE